MYWYGRKVLVTGGASFIGSHLVDRLVALGAEVRVADDLSSGKLFALAGLVGGWQRINLCRRQWQVQWRALA